MKILLTILALCIVTGATVDEEPPWFQSEPRDWIVDRAFSETNYTTKAPAGSAYFECVPVGFPTPSIEWFVYTKAEPVKVVENSSDFQLTSNKKGLFVRDARSKVPVVYCEVFNEFGRIRSKQATYKERGEPLESPSYVNPIWLTSTHGLVVCPDRNDFMINSKLPGGGILMSQRNWGAAYDYYAYYGCHDCNGTKLSMVLLSERSDLYWNGPYIVISKATKLRERIYVCLMSWKSHFITGTRQRVEFYGHNADYPRVKEYARYPFISKTVNLYGDSGDHPVRNVSMRIFSVNNDFVIGRPVVLDCVPFTFLQNLTLTWRKDGVELKDTAGISVLPVNNFGLRLMIQSLKSDDSGNYTCAINGHGSYSTIEIRPKPPFRFQRSSAVQLPIMKLKRGTHQRLECRYFTEPGESREVIWLFNGKQLTSSRVRQDGFEGISHIEIGDLSTSDNGAYQCLLQERGNPQGPNNVVTVAFLKLRAPETRHPPKISIPQRSDGTLKLSVLANGSLTGPPFSMLVSDSNGGSEGRLDKCLVEGCPPNDSCPTFVEKNRSPRGNLIIYELRGKAPTTVKSLNITCMDNADPPQRSTKTVFLDVRVTDINSSRSRSMTDRLMALLKTPLAKQNAKWWIGEMKAISQHFNAEGIKTSELLIFIEALNEGLKAEVAEKYLQEFVEGLGRLVWSDSPDIDSDISSKRRLSRKVLKLMDNLSRRMDVSSSDNRILKSSKMTIAVAILDGSPDSRLVNRFVQFSVQNSHPNASSISNRFHNESVTDVGIAVMERAVAGQRVEFSMIDYTGLFDSPFDTNGTLVTPIIGATATLRQNFSNDDVPPVVVSFKQTKERRGQLRCVYWSPSTHLWGFDGCVTSYQKPDIVLCKCTHLTNFALLLNVDPGYTISATHSLALSILSYVTLTISLLFLVLTILIYAAFLRRESNAHSSSSSSSGSSRSSRIAASKVLISLCSTLLIATLVFLIGGGYEGQDMTCSIIGVFLHYFYLSVFCWAVVEGFHIFTSVIYVSLKSNQISSHISRFFLKASIFAWGVPLVIVIVTLSVNQARSYSSNATSGPRLCFLTPLPFFIAFLTPMLICLLANIIILILLGVVLYRFSYGSVARGPTGQKTSLRQHVVGFIGVCFILNATWIIGVVQVRGGKVLFQYLHVLINGLQGLFIFVFYCILRKDIRRFIKKKVRHCLRLPDQGSSSGGRSLMSDTQSGYSEQRKNKRMSSSGATIRTDVSNSSGGNNGNSVTTMKTKSEPGEDRPLVDIKEEKD